MADRESDIVPGDRGEKAEDSDEDDVQAARAGVHGGEDQRRLAGNGNAKVLEEKQSDDGEVAVVVQRRLEGVEDAREVLGGSSGEQRAAKSARSITPRSSRPQRLPRGRTGCGASPVVRAIRQRRRLLGWRRAPRRLARG